MTQGALLYPILFIVFVLINPLLTEEQVLLSVFYYLLALLLLAKGLLAYLSEVWSLSAHAKIDVFKRNFTLRDAIRRILGFGIRSIDYLYRPCCNKIDELVEKDVLNSYGHSDASSTHFCSRTQIGESS
ncbi:hypothetical protein Tco_1041643 [Tanacetum coccineum]|uniref:ABC transmembrane type-1 domain-containing protein n=1 Tax=Tanacetum coccineum TaxID=301880 RepID=A0ABQ5GJD5_9ASTR